MFRKDTQKKIATVIVIILVLAMVVPSIASFLIY